MDRGAAARAGPGRRVVLTKVTVSDGVDLGEAFASPDQSVDFDYQSGFFHRGEKEFFGFAEVTTKRTDGVTTTQVFENRNYALRGRLLRQSVKDAGGNLFGEKRLTYEVKPVLDASGDPVGPLEDCTKGLHPLLTADACTPLFPVAVGLVSLVFAFLVLFAMSFVGSSTAGTSADGSTTATTACIAASPTSTARARSR